MVGRECGWKDGNNLVRELACKVCCVAVVAVPLDLH